MIFRGCGLPLRPADFTDDAATIGCEIATIRAVAYVESGGGGGFLGNGWPKILTETRWFDKLTGGRFRDSHPKLSTRRWVKNYKGGLAEYDRLKAMIELDAEAALKATSWGMFQILGVNHELAGFPSVRDFVTRMRHSENDHLGGFTNYVLRQGLGDALRDRRFDDFSAVYNGPRYRENRHAERMREAYDRFSVETPTTGPQFAPSLRAVQGALNAAGYGPKLKIDGISGPRTRAALRNFQRESGLPMSGVADPETSVVLFEATK